MEKESSTIKWLLIVIIVLLVGGGMYMFGVNQTQVVQVSKRAQQTTIEKDIPSVSFRHEEELKEPVEIVDIGEDRYKVEARSINQEITESDPKVKIERFLKSFLKVGETGNPEDIIAYYADSVDQYFSIKNASRKDILLDKKSYNKKWVERSYTYNGFEILDTYTKGQKKYYVISSMIDWRVVSRKGQVRQGSSHNMMTLVDNHNGFLVKAIKSFSKTSSRPKKQIEKPLNRGNIFGKDGTTKLKSKTKSISFQENGISIYLTYPSAVRAGKTFKIRAEMTNNNTDAKQGGLTLSFPDMSSMSGNILGKNFHSLKAYSASDKIYNKDTRKTMGAKYFLLEGWENTIWAYGKTKYYSVEILAPINIHNLSINVRGVLWIRNNRDLREIPLRSDVYDQQGFAVKQFSIRVN